MKKLYSLLVFLLVIFAVQAEGTKQIWPNVGIGGATQDTNTAKAFNRTVLAIWAQPGGTTSNFGTIAATPDQRIYIHIKKLGETIFLGFNMQAAPTVYYRLRRPGGSCKSGVAGATANFVPVPNAGTGFIKYAPQVQRGPNRVNGTVNSYTPISYAADSIGDWWIEFNGTQNTTNTARNSGSAAYGLEFNYWDITVADTTLPNKPEIPGRVFSREWNFNVSKITTGGDPVGNGACTTCGSKGVIYVYTKDSVTDKIDFNTTFLPRAFFIDANSSGCTKPPTPTYKNRASQINKISYPEYPVFLSKPDSLCYPTGQLPSIKGNPKLKGCGVGVNYRIEVTNTHSGQNRVFIDKNANGKYDLGTADRLLLTNASPGKNIIIWDGKDGFGANVVGPISIVCQYQGGIVHFPVYDAENCAAGLIFSLVRPTAFAVQTRVYYNDKQISAPAGGVADTTADAGTSGGVFGGQATHKWGTNAPAPNPNATDWGNNNTLNTWIETTYDSKTISGVITPGCPVYTAVKNKQCLAAYSIGDVVATVTDPDGAITAAVIDSLSLPPGLGLLTDGSVVVTNAAAMVAGTYTTYIAVTDGIGGEARAQLDLQFYPVLTSGSVAAPATTTFCGSGDPGTITNVLPNPTGGDGTYTYQWQSSADGSTGWTNVSSATGNTYDPPLLSTTTYYKRVVSSAGCSQSSNVVGITIQSTVANNSISISPSTFCGTQDPGAIQGTTPTGGDNTTYFYSWQESTDNVTFNPVAGGVATPTYDPGSLSSTMYYKRGVTSGTCSTPSFSTSLKITIETPVGNNTISPAGTTTYCVSGNPGTFTGTTPTGGNNAVFNYQWQSSSTGAAGSYSDIPGMTNPTYAPGIINATTYYRRGVTSGSCIGATYINYSAPIKITIVSAITNNTLNPVATATFCNSGDPGTLTGSVPLNGEGTYTYQWQSSSTSGGVYADITGAIDPTYAPGTITTTTYYRRVVSSGSCNGTTSNNSGPIGITIQPSIGNNNASAPGATTFCVSGAPGVLYGSPAAGGNGTFTYQWQSSPNGASSWADVSGATASTYDPGTVVTTTYYRRNVSSGSCNGVGTNNSNFIKITIEPAIGGNTTVSASGSTTFCVSGDPGTLSVTAPSGGNGTYTYQWQYSPNGISSWSDINLETNPTYAPGTINATSYYRRAVFSGTCNTAGNINYSSPIKITIQNAIAGNSASAPGTTTFCSSGDPGTFTGTTPTGGSGTYSYQWQSGPSNTGPWTNITGETASTYAPGTITTTTYYRRGVTSGSCSGASTNFSNPAIQITIQSGISNNTVSAPGATTFCAMGDPGALTGTSPAGGNGTYSYQWQSSPTGAAGTWTDVSGIISPVYDPGNVTVTTYFRRTVTSGSCSTPSPSTNSIKVTINALPSADAGADQIISNGSSVSIGGSPTGSGTIAPYSYLWSPATALSSTTTGNPTASPVVTTTYVVTVTDGNGCKNQDQVVINVGATANLKITKTASSAPYYNGQNITYTLTVSNLGPDNATGVVVTDVLPAGLTYVSATASSGSYSGGVWTANNISNSSSATLSIVAKINTTGSIKNKATVVGNENDNSLTNNADSVTINALPSANLAFTKTASAAPYRNGQNIVYTLTVKNNGPDAATGVQVNEYLPSSLTYVSSSTINGTYNSGSSIWSVGALPVGNSAVLTITVTPNQSGLITNSAKATAAEFDKDTTDNKASVGTNVAKTTDLSITKTASAGPYNVGQNLNYVLNIKNNGPDDASSIVVTDLLPVGVSYVSHSGGPGVYDKTTGLWSVGTLGNGGTGSLTITVKLDSSKTITNTARITGGQYDADTTNNVAVAPISGGTSADLKVTKTANTLSPFNGDSVVYTITATNMGPNIASAVKVIDNLPAGLSLRRATATKGSYSGGTWTIGTFNTSSPATLTIVANITSTLTTIVNTATISGADYDNNMANNSQSVTINPQPSANLVITKTAPVITYRNGSNITYTITLINNGPNTATSVLVNDLLAPNLSYLSSTPSSGSYSNVTGKWNIGTLYSGQSETLFLTAQINGSGNITNTAIASAAEHNGNPSKDTATCVINATPTADLWITKVASAGPYNLNQPVTYTITANNRGPNTATGVVVTDLLPSGLQYQNYTTSDGSIYDRTSGNWTIGNMVSGGSVTLTIFTSIKSTGSIQNNASINGTNYDNDPTNNSVSNTINVGTSADLGVTKVVLPGTYINGHQVTYKIKAFNAGPDDATGVIVNDLLDTAALVYNSSTPTLGSYLSNTGKWNIGYLAKGDTAALTIVATLKKKGTVVNTASIVGDDYDGTAGNNVATVSINSISSADLQISKTVSAGPYVNSGALTYTIKVTNNGPDAASSVVARDLLPAGITFGSYTSSQGIYNSGSGIWNISALPSGSIATLTLQCTINGTGVILNTATVAAAENDDNMSNDTAKCSISVGTNADLKVIKKINGGPSYYNGKTVVYTIVASNAGPNDATGVLVNDLLDANNLDYISSVASRGTYDTLNGHWTLGGFTKNTSDSLKITAIIRNAGSITNTATISANDYDPDVLSNTSTVTVNAVANADLSITKVASAGPYYNGQQLTYTVTIKNQGPNIATGVAAKDLLPSNLNYINATPTVGSYNSSDGGWNVGTLDVGGSATLNILCVPNSAGIIINTATVKSNVFDSDTLTNKAVSTITANPSSNLSISKTSTAGPYSNNQQIVYSITVNNSGPNDATGVVVTDILPAGLVYVSSSPAGAYSAGTWNVGFLKKNTPQTLNITVQITGTGLIVNKASIKGNEFDPDTLSNVATKTISVGTTADLSLTGTVGAGPYYNGQNVTYTLTVHNGGPNDAIGVVMKDLLPANLTFVSSSDPANYSAVTGNWNIGALANGADVVLTVIAKFNGTGNLTNSASVTGTDYDADLSNNDVVITTPVSPSVDLSVTKNVSAGPYTNGQSITYTISVANAGPDSATSVNVLDQLPSMLTYVSSTAFVGNYDNISGVWTIGTLKTGGAPAILQVVATITGTGTIDNIAVVSSNEYDSNTPNNTVKKTIKVGTRADLSVVKTTTISGPFNHEQSVTYTITVSNAGPDVATGVMVTDSLPSQLTLTSSSATKGSYDVSSRLWNIDSVIPGKDQVLTLTAFINAAGTITNKAVVTGNDYDDTPGNNTSIKQISANKSADLSVLKNISPGPYKIGDTITYTIIVGNNGPDDASKVVVQDKLPTGMNYVSSSATTGGVTYDAIDGVKWAVGTLADNGGATIKIRVLVTASGDIFNTATIGGDDYDPSINNNTFTRQFHVGTTVDLTLVKSTITPGPFMYGQNVSYSLQVTNNGPSKATGIKVQDVLPRGLKYISSSATNGSYGSDVWNVGSLTNGSSAVLTINTQIDSTGTIINSAGVTGNDFDLDESNNTDTAAIYVGPAADLVVTKVASPGPYYAGQTVTYTITASNNGPDLATKVTVDDLLPSSLTYQSSKTTTGSYASNKWSLGALSKGQKEVLTLVAKINSGGTINNIVAINSAVLEINPVSNRDTATIVADATADLSINKTIFPAGGTYHTGQTVTYTITVNNAGPSDATGVKVTELLPAGLTYQSSVPSPGTSYSSVNGIWDINALAGGKSAKLTITATLSSKGIITNTATVSGTEKDNSLQNNSSTVKITVSPAIDLDIKRSVSAGPYYEGNVVRYTIVIQNLGPDNATGVDVTNVLPSKLTFKNATPSFGTYVNVTNVWTVGNLNAGSSAGLIVDAFIADTGKIGNTISISGKEYETVLINNTFDNFFNAEPSTDLAVKKAVSAGPYYNGDDVSYTITAYNYGPSRANNISVKDVLPAGLQFVSATSSTGSYSQSTGDWAIQSFPANTVNTLTIKAKMIQPGIIKNKTAISGLGFDPTPSNGADSVTITVLPTSHVDVKKTIDKPAVTMGGEVNYTITAHNTGPDKATQVIAVDKLPSGLIYVSSSAQKGSYDKVTGNWTIGELTSGESSTLTIRALVMGTGTIINTATITFAEHDPDHNDDTSKVAVKSNNIPPVALNESTTTFKNQAVTIRILDNDYDPDGKAGDDKGIDAGTVEVNPDGTVGFVQAFNLFDKAITYVPKPEFVGIDKFYYTVKDKEGGISNVATVTIIVDETFEIPNGFSPDGDGKNDKWEIKGLESYPNNEVLIFNRWGNEVFRTSNYSESNTWDGSGLNGGTYFYIIKISVAGIDRSFTGYVTLIK